MGFMGNTGITINWGSFGRHTGRSGLNLLEQAFYDSYVDEAGKINEALRDTLFIQNAAREYAQKQAAIVRKYQREYQITEISDFAHNDLINEVWDARREVWAARRKVEAEKAVSRTNEVAVRSAERAIAGRDKRIESLERQLAKAGMRLSKTRKEKRSLKETLEKATRSANYWRELANARGRVIAGIRLNGMGRGNPDLRAAEAAALELELAGEPEDMEVTTE